METALDEPYPDEFPLLVCFAVKEEASHFHSKRDGISQLITGMGQNNAAASVRSFLEKTKPRYVITAGFAGGLNPKLSVGTVVFDKDVDTGMASRLQACGAVPAQFHCSHRVAVTAIEKAELQKSTGADAVEMESAVIRAICAEYQIPSATIRVISDAAGDDLPLDFNALMNSNDRINYGKLIWQLLRSPQKIPQLIKFQKTLGIAARNLGNALGKSLPDGR